MAGELTAAIGKPVRHDAVPPDVYRSLGFPGAEDLGNMFPFKAEFTREYVASRDLATSRELNPQLLDFHGWVQANAERIPVG